MAAVTSPETSPQPRVYFQTPAGTTEEPETPVRKQGRVTVKYDRKELRKRLNLEEWIIDQLTDLYDCEVKTQTITGLLFFSPAYQSELLWVIL
uniref:Protein phosphatase 1, regulatory (inhibitor) subunit 14Bb n=1 Tax=Labrus bergylta TaxID=56723 RepID=A0A3Q3N638_9LABR